MSSLPPEIWGLVVDLLQQRDQRTCLFLSRVLHDIVFPNLFSHFRVTLGLWIWRPWTLADKRIHPSSNEQEHMVRRNNITLNILRAISSRPDFAKVVTEFTVHACAWDGSENTSSIEQQHCLVAALEVLSNLRAFHWYGQRPTPSSAIFNALGAGSLTTLTEIHIPMLEDMAAALPQLYHFSSLRSLSLVRQGANTGPGHNASGEVINSLSDIRAGTLTHLSISGDVIWRRESFSGLQELELIFAISFAGLPNILRHCAALTSLTMLLVGLANLNEIFTALGTHPNTLPGLTAFKYFKSMDSDQATTPEQIAALCDFLRSNRHLRRLDVVFGDGDDREDDPFLELLRELPALEVLGFDFARGDWLPDDIAFFERVIPAHLSALRVGQLVLVHDRELCASYRAAWLKLLKSRTSLRYLHIFESFIGPPEKDTALRLRQLPIEELPGSLELYGYGLYMHPVVREPLDDADADSSDNAARPPTFGPCWPLEKVAFRTKEDFQCADWEWLLRWHDYSGLDMLRPGVLPNGPPWCLHTSLLPQASSL